MSRVRASDSKPEKPRLAGSSYLTVTSDNGLTARDILDLADEIRARNVRDEASVSLMDSNALGGFGSLHVQTITVNCGDWA